MAPDSGAGAVPARQGAAFLALYALAAAGGAVAYVPFLTLLLPVKLEGLAGAHAVAAVAWLAFAGALAASVSHIAFGWASDLGGRRRPWIAAGLALSCGLLVAMGAARDLATLALLLVAWQGALNMMLAPLAAWAADCIPAGQRGRLGGLLSLSPALGAAAGALVTRPGLIAGEWRAAAIAGLVAAMVLPALLLARPRAAAPASAESRPKQAPEAPPPAAADRRAAVVMWLARLLVQIAEAALFAYLLFWFRSIDPRLGADRVAMLFGLVLAGSIPVAVIAGWASDRFASPARPLAALAGAAALGLVGMAASQSLAQAVAGYLVFGLASGAFLALHSAQTLGVLANPARRGRDLGVFNLTNTVPSLVMPWLALGLVPGLGYAALFASLAALVAAAALLLLRESGR